MGLDAFVRCNCYRDGQAQPFPLPHLEAHIVVNDDGFLALNVPEDDHPEALRQFDEWKSHACPHEGMMVVFERISNWSGYRAFQEALGRMGWRHFPTLERELPALNGGQMPTAAAVRVLAELGLFRRRIGQQHNLFLVNSDSGDVVYEYIAVYDGVFMWSGDEKLNFGFNAGGFFIAAQHPQSAVRNGRVLFQALRLEQRLLSAPGEPLRVEYFNADTEERFLCHSLTGGTIDDYPALLHVEERPLTPEDFEYILLPLQKVCEAAIATGNPVVWC
ncbi:MAG: hypothetical protein MUE40_17095 [Anaerolineae bacterium]|jgi:hypothetical protein|nr:hypothetical protein [Anaerolineae bacterium]